MKESWTCRSGAAGAVAGAAQVQALSPPFIPFTSTGNAAAGAFTLR